MISLTIRRRQRRLSEMPNCDLQQFRRGEMNSWTTVLLLLLAYATVYEVGAFKWQRMTTSSPLVQLRQ